MTADKWNTVYCSDESRAYWATMDAKYGTDRPAEGQMTDAEWARIDEIRCGVVTKADRDAKRAREDRVMMALDTLAPYVRTGRTDAPGWVSAELGAQFVAGEIADGPTDWQGDVERIRDRRAAEDADRLRVIRAAGKPDPMHDRAEADRLIADSGCNAVSTELQMKPTEETR